MMNLTGDGTGLDMVTMPQAMREQVPTSNFFQRSGYERNPVAIRNNTVAKLLAVTDARMDSQQQQPGRQGSGGGVLAHLSSRRDAGIFMPLRRAGTVPSAGVRTAPALQRIASQGLRAALRPGTTSCYPGPNLNLPSPSRYGPVRIYSWPFSPMKNNVPFGTFFAPFSRSLALLVPIL